MTDKEEARKKQAMVRRNLKREKGWLALKYAEALIRVARERRWRAESFKLLSGVIGPLREEIALYKKALGLNPAKTLSLPELKKLVALREGADDMFSSSHVRGVALQAQLANVKTIIEKASREGENAIVVRKNCSSVHFVDRLKSLGYTVSEHNSTNVRISWLQEVD